MIGDEHWSPAAPRSGCTEQVAETLRQTAALICDGKVTRSTIAARIEAVQESARRLDRLMRPPSRPM